jgi:hypothetical protein
VQAKAAQETASPTGDLPGWCVHRWPPVIAEARPSTS